LTEICERHHVSVKTISSYPARFMEKIRMESNAQLTRYAMANSLIE